jgi:four helix bundle protein
MAQGSNYEVQTQLVLSGRLNLGEEAKLQRSKSLSVEVGKMLSALIGSIATKR